MHAVTSSVKNGENKTEDGVLTGLMIYYMDKPEEDFDWSKYTMKFPCYYAEKLCKDKADVEAIEKAAKNR